MSPFNPSHIALPGSHRPMKPGARWVRSVDPDHTIQVTITLRGPALPDPGANPEGSLAPEEFAARYGASQADADAVAGALTPLGLKIDDVSLPTRSMQVSGPIAAFQKAFQPNLAIYH